MAGFLRYDSNTIRLGMTWNRDLDTSRVHSQVLESENQVGLGTLRRVCGIYNYTSRQCLSLLLQTSVCSQSRRRTFTIKQQGLLLTTGHILHHHM